MPSAADSAVVERPPSQDVHAERAPPQRQPPYAVILHNDDLNTFPFVIRTLQKVFGFTYAQAQERTERAHHAGCCVVWSGMREVAELKADQIRSCGPDPQMAARGAQRLTVTIEPLPQ